MKETQITGMCFGFVNFRAYCPLKLFGSNHRKPHKWPFCVFILFSCSLQRPP